MTLIPIQEAGEAAVSTGFASVGYLSATALGSRVADDLVIRLFGVVPHHHHSRRNSDVVLIDIGNFQGYSYCFGILRLFSRAVNTLTISG